MNTVNLILTIALAIITMFQAFFVGKISKIKGYKNAKGENLATKQDIEEITNKIESVKNEYNKALKKYSFELQKEYESKRYSFDFCYSIDKELIEIIINCFEGMYLENSDIDPRTTTPHAFGPLSKLNHFLHIYRFRYSVIDFIPEIIEITNETFSLNLNETYEMIIDNDDYKNMKEKVAPLLEQLLSIMLPKIQINILKK